MRDDSTHPAQEGSFADSNTLSLYGHSVGQWVCASLGETNDYECGNVTDVDRDNVWINSYGIPEDEGTVRNRIAVGGVQCEPGDSGAGVVNGSTIHGLLTNCPSPTNGGTTVTAFVPAYYVKSYIGNSSFDFNCRRTSNGSWWASCPIVYS